MLPLRVGILVALVASVAYEPLRWLTTMLSPSLDEALGGVGGVGGLANLGSPTANCSTTTGGARAPYCFYPGLVFGLTPFALVVLAVWVLPLALGALAATARKCAATLAPTASTATASRSLCGAWVLMNVAWFALPLAQYCFLDPFLDRSLWSRVLAASIAAAYPLSWNLSLVAIPSAGASYLPPLLAVSRAQLISTHKVAACSSLFWALLHAGGQIAYFVSAGKLRAQLSPSKGEHLLYCFGALTLALLLALATLAAFRRHRGIAPWFRAAHRAMATLALLSAAAHWWPFALLLCPAVAVGATGAAVLARAKVECEREGELQDGQLAGGPRASAAALAASPYGLCAGASWAAPKPIPTARLPSRRWPSCWVASWRGPRPGSYWPDGATGPSTLRRCSLHRCRRRPPGTPLRYPSPSAVNRSAAAIQGLGLWVAHRLPVWAFPWYAFDLGVRRPQCDLVKS